MQEGDRVVLKGHPNKVWTVTSATEKYIWLDGIPGGHARTDFTLLTEGNLEETIKEVKETTLDDIRQELDEIFHEAEKTEEAMSNLAHRIQEVAIQRELETYSTKRQIIAATIVSALIFGAVLVSIIW